MAIAMVMKKRKKQGISNKMKLHKMLNNDKLTFEQKWELMLRNYSLDAPSNLGAVVE